MSWRKAHTSDLINSSFFPYGLWGQQIFMNSDLKAFKLLCFIKKQRSGSHSESGCGKVKIPKYHALLDFCLFIKAIRFLYFNTQF